MDVEIIVDDSSTMESELELRSDIHMYHSELQQEEDNTEQVTEGNTEQSNITKDA